MVTLGLSFVASLAMARAVSPAEIHWSGSRRDQQALACRSDWSQITGLEQLWPVLAERHGEALALEAPYASTPEQLSYRQLHQRIEQAAAAFAGLGVGAGDVVALFAENGPRWLQADQGLMRAGAADAVRGSAAPLEELRYILDDSGAVALVVESAALLEKLALEDTRLARLRFVLVLEGERGDLGDLLEGATPAPCLSWGELLERGAAALASGTPAPPPPGDAARLATILYTSGTTGQPKGVPLSHANLLHQLRHLGVAVAPRPGDRVVSVLPIWCRCLKIPTPTSMSAV